jgi:hypothetical protein
MLEDGLDSRKEQPMRFIAGRCFVGVKKGQEVRHARFVSRELKPPKKVCHCEPLSLLF